MTEMASRVWPGDDRGKLFWACVCANRRLQGELCAARQQSSPHKVQIGQREDGKRARRVLSQTKVTNHGEAPQALDHMKGVLAARSAARSRPVDGALILGQRMVLGLGSAVDAIANPGVLALLPMIFAPIRLVPVKLKREWGFGMKVHIGASKQGLVLLAVAH